MNDPIQVIKQADNLSEKYLRINMDFPEMAGKLESLHAVQKRLLERLPKSKQSSDQATLLIAVADSIEVTEAFIQWVHTFLKEVVKDSEALVEGSKARTTAKWASQMNTELMDARK